jgi:hypothetical protein
MKSHIASIGVALAIVAGLAADRRRTLRPARYSRPD